MKNQQVNHQSALASLSCQANCQKSKDNVNQMNILLIIKVKC